MSRSNYADPLPDDLATLIAAIRTRMRPRAIWLFGSRARGDHRADSDWDLVVAVPDDVSDDALDPIIGWSIGREAGISATILAARESELAESWGVPNTLSYALAREGLRLDVQGA
ncbi:nucleotidyltransferase domain-containing protein [Methylobacterium sp. E-041]|uniref:nucleotidyltransferase domain-containing protein n=1 Tax=unclassified Methylobacterium TaxID=2615210 RepID=UPI001FB86C9B|nr:nucleotidyltransferase domain-containing protein [Methylobacterium sp. E-041]MCJ2106591.1 nucleotidyltransferase domain-containing protein [Methylobacterium sp. E-041]